ncbi:MAG: PAS domain-containing protein [Deltaproteobacteria bacterium]|jgi:two-component system, sensor histidine kinase and response regulator|nr:PAS domain-containing protein [Deltaproteobacteria bacterium]
MGTVIQLIEAFFSEIPLPLLEIWGRFGYILGFILMICAFGRITFRPGGRWGVGLERQTWDSKAIQSMLLTFLLIIGTGYMGSFIVLVPGAQTFESLKDVSVFLCVLLFGYPALIIVPFAYGIADLIEGVPPAYLWDWIFGYFINPSCFWVAYQFIGRDPDFRKARTWGWYLFFVVIFMSIEPQLWGYICSPQFTSAISFGNITPALFFTTSVTWLLAPFAMLVALPLARRFGLFWAEIPNHVKERVLGKKEWVWESGKDETDADSSEVVRGIPIRMLIVFPFVFLVLLMIGSTAFFVLRNAETDANKLAGRLLQEIAENINLQLDDHMQITPKTVNPENLKIINELFKQLPMAKQGRAFLMDHSGRLVATSLEGTHPTDRIQTHPATDSKDPVVQNAVRTLYQILGGPKSLNEAVQFRFDVLTAKPLSKVSWLAQASHYQNKTGGHSDWILVTALPEGYFLGGVAKGSSQTAMVMALALVISLGVAGILAAMVITPIKRLSRASEEFSKGNLTQRVPTSSLEELGTLSLTFNNMAEQISESRERIRLATRTMNLGIWDWNIVSDELIWDEQMCRLYGIREEEFGGAYDAWTKRVFPEDLERANAEIQEALRGEREYACNYRIVWPDGSIHFIEAASQTFRDPDGKPFRMVGVNYDITERKQVDEALRASRDYLEKLTNSMWDTVLSVKMPERVIEWVNDSIRLIGYEPSECVGKDTAFLYSNKDDFLDLGNKLENAMAAGKDVLHTEQLFRRKTGETFPVEITATFHKKNDEVVRVTSIVRDVTERKESQAELEMYQRHLETLVKEQTTELEEKVMELERMNDVFVGREFRIKELRVKVKALEQKIDN